MHIPVRLGAVLCSIALFSCLATGPAFSRGQTPLEVPKIEKLTPRTDERRPGSDTKQKTVSVDSVRLLARPRSISQKPTEITGWRETESFLLLPSRKFDIVCRVTEDKASYSQDFLVWTTIDFLVTRPSKRFERMTPEQLDQEYSWGQVVEMDDLKSAPVYFLGPGESRSIVIKGYDLSAVMASFPPNDPAPLWPWLMRINIHVQDRSGNEVGFGSKVLSLRPYASRIKSDFAEPPNEMKD